MAKVVTLGEIMLRLAPPNFERPMQSAMFVATFGGGEANVAVSTANPSLPWLIRPVPVIYMRPDSCTATRKGWTWLCAVNSGRLRRLKSSAMSAPGRRRI